MISKTMRSILHALSYGNIDVESSRRIADLKKLDAMRIFIRKLDTKICNGDYEVPVRMYFPSEETMEQEKEGKLSLPVLLFFHGGGFVTGDFDSYSNVCATLAAQTGYKVVSVNYRLAPEHKFPAGVEDCYAVTQQILTHCEEWYQVSADQVILIGDSAGATLSCVTSFLCRDRGGLMPGGQILIYPAAWCDYTDATPFASVAENGADYILTRKKLLDYMELYASEPEDRLDPRFAPLRNTDFSGLPPTLLLTMEFDPLRDEGEDAAFAVLRREILGRR